MAGYDFAKERMVAFIDAETNDELLFKVVDCHFTKVYFYRSVAATFNFIIIKAIPTRELKVQLRNGLNERSKARKIARKPNKRKDFPTSM